MCVQANGQSTGSTSASKLSAGYDWVLMEADTGMETGVCCVSGTWGL